MRRQKHRAGISRTLRLMFLGCAVVAVLIATFWPGLYAGSSPVAVAPIDALIPPSASHPLGTDQLGRDIFARCIYAFRLDLGIGAVGVAIAAVVGVPMGLLAGYRGRVADVIALFIVNGLLSFPLLLLALLLVAAFGASAATIIAAVAVLDIPIFARLARATALDLRRAGFVDAARIFGASEGYILSRILLPNATGPLIVQANLGLALAISVETSLSFLGLGVAPPTPSWGSMLGTAQSYMSQAPWFAIAPGIFVVGTILLVTSVGSMAGRLVDPTRRMQVTGGVSQ